MLSSDNIQAALEARLRYTFQDRDLLSRALTHRSAGGAKTKNYERLEFLGDRILAFTISDALLRCFPDEPEGHLSRRLNALVRRETLAEIATELTLGPAIRFGPSEELEGGDNPAILADVCEALIAAIYRDGGIEAAQDFILRHWEHRLDATPKPPRDAKSSLQEWTMARGLGLPIYEEVARSGPDHAPVFTIRVSVPGHGAIEADGKSKRVAEQSAAGMLLKRLEDAG